MLINVAKPFRDAEIEKVPDGNVICKRVMHFPYVLWHYRLPTYRCMKERLIGGLVVCYCEVESDLIESWEGEVEKRGYIRKIWGCRFGGWRVLLCFGPLLAAARKSADVLLLEWSLRNLVLIPATLLARLRGIRVVWWGHGIPKRVTALSSVHFLLGRILPSAVLVYMPQARDLLIKKYSFDKTRVFVAPNAVDVRRFDQIRACFQGKVEKLNRVREELGLKSELRYLIYSGRLLPGRDLDRIVNAVSELKDRGIGAGAIFVGGGPELFLLQSQARKLGIDDRIVFAGTIHDPHQLVSIYMQAEVCVIPGWLGLTLTQGAAMGLPAVISNRPELHNPEVHIFKDGVTGLVYNYQKNDLSEKLELLLSDRERLLGMGGAAKEIVNQSFSIDHMVEGIVNACAGVGK